MEAFMRSGTFDALKFEQRRIRPGLSVAANARPVPTHTACREFAATRRVWRCERCALTRYASPGPLWLAGMLVVTLAVAICASS